MSTLHEQYVPERHQSLRYALGTELGVDVWCPDRTDCKDWFPRLSEFFLGLVPQDGKHPAKIPQNFRWILGEYLDLPFSGYSHNRNQRRRLQPDAALEIPSQRSRIFVEIETGSATIWDQEKMTSTLAKLNRYSEFLSGYAGNVHHGDSSTFYSRALPRRLAAGAAVRHARRPPL